MIGVGPVTIGEKESKWILIAAGLGLVFVVYKAWSIKNEIAAEIADPENPINRTAEGAYQVFTGRRDATPATDLYDMGHDSAGNANWFGWFLDSVAGTTKLTEQNERLNQLTAEMYPSKP